MLGVWDWVSVGMLVMGLVGNLSWTRRWEQEDTCTWSTTNTLDVSFFYWSCLFYYYTIPEQQYEALLNYNFHILDPGFVSSTQGIYLHGDQIHRIRSRGRLIPCPNTTSSQGEGER
jgi:hypothetical protein